MARLLFAFNQYYFTLVLLLLGAHLLLAALNFFRNGACEYADRSGLILLGVLAFMGLLSLDVRGIFDTRPFIIVVAVIALFPQLVLTVENWKAFNAIKWRRSR